MEGKKREKELQASKCKSCPLRFAAAKETRRELWPAGGKKEKKRRGMSLQAVHLGQGRRGGSGRGGRGGGGVNLPDNGTIAERPY